MDKLTFREKQVCEALLETPGLTVTGIACYMNDAPTKPVTGRSTIKPRTVKYHLGNVYAALGVRSKTELVAVLHRVMSE